MPVLRPFVILDALEDMGVAAVAYADPSRSP